MDVCFLVSPVLISCCFAMILGISLPLRLAPDMNLFERSMRGTSQQSESFGGRNASRSSGISTSSEHLGNSTREREPPRKPLGGGELSAPPWIPPTFDDASWRRFEAGYQVAARCTDACRRRFGCTDEEVPECSWSGAAGKASCSCRGPHRLPSELALGPAEHERNGTRRLAILMAGLVRTFLHPMIKTYWQWILRQLLMAGLEIQVIAVLGLHSKNKGNQRVRVVPQSAVEEALNNLKVPWVAEFTRGDATWQEAAKQVRDPALASMLSPLPVGHPDQNSGLYNGRRMYAIAFDLMLRFEVTVQKGFDYVLQLRPDTVWDPGQSMAELFDCRDAVAVYNDEIAVMPRRFASWYYTSLATHRSLWGTGPSPMGDIGRLQDPKYYRDFCLPVGHLAYHGIPFAGFSLRLQGDSIPCRTLSQKMGDSWIIRWCRDFRRWCAKGRQVWYKTEEAAYAALSGFVRRANFGNGTLAGYVYHCNR